MFFNYLWQSYSFNCLALFGFISFFISLITFINEFSIEDLNHFSEFCAIYLFIYVKVIFLFNILGFLFAILIFMFEIPLKLKIESQKFLNLKHLRTLQIIGFILEITPILFALYIILNSYYFWHPYK